MTATATVPVRVLDGPAAGEQLDLDRCPDCGSPPDGFGFASSAVRPVWYRILEDDAHPGEFIALMVAA